MNFSKNHYPVEMKLRFLLVFVITATLSIPLGSLNAASYVTISGQVLNSKGMPIGEPSTVNISDGINTIIGQIDSSGKYSMNVVANTKLKATFVLVETSSENSISGISYDNIRTNPGFSNWSADLEPLKGNKTLNFTTPAGVEVNAIVADGQANASMNAVVQLSSINQEHDSYSFGGLVWTGIQRPSGNSGSFFSQDGSFTFYFYPTKNFSGFSFYQTTDAKQPWLRLGNTYSTPKFSITKDISVQLCMPVNLGTSMKTADSCIENQLKYEATAVKKTTITCVKGKLTKKVTAIIPKCPAGYKKR